MAALANNRFYIWYTISEIVGCDIGSRVLETSSRIKLTKQQSVSVQPTFVNIKFASI